MQLTRVVLDGFKSFATRTEFKFYSSISCIVGPNGSGKSNIVDAIRWALGEQSPRALRGGKMTDIIFSGTEGLPERQKAEVILELAGEEFSGKKKTIKRKVDSTGQGYYFMDGYPCRLKDIKDLFLDSGVGSQGYALVGQGEVEGILLATPKERRKIFDEVAGILKIRIHKEEAEGGLEETEKDLQRIGDIIQELKKREGPLGRDSKKAQEYLHIKEELKKREINLLLYQYVQEGETLKEVQGLMDQLGDQLQEKRKDRDGGDAKVLQLRESLEEMGDSMAEGYDALTLMKTRLQESKNIFSLNQEKINHLLSAQGRIKGQEGEMEGQEQRIKERLKGIEGDRRELSLQIQEKQAALKEKEGLLLQIKEREQILKEKGERLQELHLQDREYLLTQGQKREQYLKEEGEYKEKKKVLFSRLMRIEEDLEEQKKRIQHVQGEIKDLVDTCQQLQIDLKSLGDHRDEIGKKGEVLLKEAALKQKKLESLKTRHELLKEMEEDLKGFFPGVRSLLKDREKNKTWGPGIVGVMAHLIHFPPSLKEAIQAALGSRGQNVVVKKEEDARLAVSYLHQHALGRVTFLPLNTIKVHSFLAKEEERLQAQGILGPLVDHITFDEEVAPAVYHLLGRVVLAEDLKDASVLAPQFNYRLKIVTLKGDLLLPGGAITGGSFQEKAGIIQRRGELKELKEKIGEELQQLEKVSLVKEGVDRESLLLDEEIEGKKTSLQRIQLKLASLKEEQLYLQREEGQLLERKKDLQEDRDSCDERLRELQGNLKSLQIQVHQQDGKDYAEKLEDNKNKLKFLQREVEEITSKMTTLQVDLATLKKEEEQGQKQFLELQKDLKKLRQGQGDKIQELKEIHEEKKRLIGKQGSLKEDEEDYQRQIRDLEERLSIQKRKKEELSVQLREGEERLKDTRRIVEELFNSERTLSLKLTKSRIQLENLREKLLDYRVEPEDDPHLEEISSPRKEQLMVKKLKEEMEDLGTVNLGAIEEYQELKERLTFLTEQSQDLKEAREAMKQVIKEIEGGMKERFLKTFHAINHAFQEVFSNLFQGGFAQLILEEGDPLESGVEMMAQPPGKKLQHLSLMSGGEKALTAIALIFALLKVQPSPFYILDEIDASLDETNLDRFVHYMDTCNTTQFIIITHRRRTMSTADTLYGLTIKDGAFSQLISVDLKDREKVV